MPGDADAVLDIESGVFTELLDVSDEVTGHTFADEFGCEYGADGDLNTGIIGGHPFGCLLRGDEDIIGVEVDGLSIELDLDGSAAAEGSENGVTEFGEFGAECVEEFAVARSERFEVGFVGVGDEVIEVILAQNGVDIEFFADDIGEGFDGRGDIWLAGGEAEFCERLSDAEGGIFAELVSEADDFLGCGHAKIELVIEESGVRRRELAEVYGFREL